MCLNYIDAYSDKMHSTKLKVMAECLALVSVTEDCLLVTIRQNKFVISRACCSKLLIYF